MRASAFAVMACLVGVLGSWCGASAGEIAVGDMIVTEYFTRQVKHFPQDPADQVTIALEPSSRAHEVSFSPDGASMFVAYPSVDAGTPGWPFGTVVKYDGSTGQRICALVDPANSGGMKGPVRAEFGLDGKFYVLDGVGNKHPDPAMTFVGTVFECDPDGLSLPTPVITQPLENPWGLAISPVTGNIFLSDFRGETAIYEYESSGGSWQFVYMHNDPNFTHPQGLCFDEEGVLYAANHFQAGTGNNAGNVIRYDVTTRTVLATYPGLNGPTVPAIGPDGRLYVTESTDSQVSRLNPDTNVWEVVVGSGDLATPYGLGFRTPEPTTLGLLALGSLAVLRRRRK